MTRYRATLAYDGTAYQGFQRQAQGIPTIQGAVEDAVFRVTQQTATVIGAGRTDTGVHATGQIIAFDVEWTHEDRDLLRALNALLPDDIALQDIRQQEGFHPRFDASSRLYRYMVVEANQRQPLLVRTSWQVRPVIHLEAMQTAAQMLIGKHDFAAFGTPPQGENTVRDVFRSAWDAQQHSFGRRLVYEIEATAFLQHMVRRIVGMLVEVGRGRLDVSEFEHIFHRADLSLTKAVAPPQGLFLERVFYPGDAENL